MASRAGDGLALPGRVEEVTAEFLTEALRIEHPDVVVMRLDHAKVRHGSNSTVRLVLEYNRAGHEAGLPATMYAKGQWTPRALDRGSSRGPVREARFYQDVAPLLPELNVPACHFAGVSPDGGAVIVMEDLLARNAILGSAGESLTVEQAYLLADQLAMLHALWFDAPELAAVDWLAGDDEGDDVDRMAEEETGIFGSFQEWWWEKRTHFPHNEFLPPELLDRQVVKRALVNKYKLEDAGPKCLIHGDPHLGNMFMDRQGRPGLYDWGPRAGRWANDLNYAIVGSLEVEDRRAHERDILRHYLERLSAHGGPEIGWDDAWLAWRRQAIHGFMYMLCSPRQQPEELIALQTERFGYDAMDIDMLDALGV
jgi:hypothetical protein